MVWFVTTWGRLPPDELAAVDDWLSGQKEPLSRPEAIRRLVAMALKSTRKGGKPGR